MNKINLLPENVINQIKAGEVIDSPAGIIKELIENSIDSKATNIDLHLIENGIEQITIEDNGHGINFKDLPLAFCRHATSKLSTFKDLYQLNSLGFRGEALASLASVSDIKCLTTTDKESSQFHLKGEKIITHSRLDTKLSRSGTKFIIKDLFFNTPARMKFLQSKSKQKNEIKKIFDAFLLAYPDINFSIKFDDKEKVIFQSTNLEQRIRNVVKLQIDELSIIENSYEEIDAKIYLGNIEKSRPIQKIIVNDRFISHDKIKNTINYTLLNQNIPKNKDWIIFLKLPTHQIDINVHPKKTTILFHQESTVLSLISSSIKNFLKKNAQENIKNSSFEINTQNNNFQSPTLDHWNTKPEVSNSSKDNHLETFTPHAAYRVVYSWPDNSLFLIEKDESVFVVTKSKLITSILGQVKTSETIPLLVAEPIEHEIDENLLTSLNVEIEKYENEILIRSLPEVLSIFNIKEIILQCQEEDLNKSFEKVIFHSNEVQYYLNSKFLNFSCSEINSNQISQSI